MKQQFAEFLSLCYHQLVSKNDDKFVEVNMDKQGLVDAFYGAVGVGERGQVVIPAKARADLNIKAGDKLCVIRHQKSEAIVLIKIDALRDFD